MKDLFDPSAVAELKARMARLRADSERQWGRMSPAQAMAHCAVQMQMVVGETFPPRSLLGRLVGRFAKAAMLKDEPSRRNLPTDRHFLIHDERDLDVERARLAALLDRFAAGGAEGVTRHPHSFFGVLTPEEWAALMYKHVDHHLRQFGA